MSGRMPPISHVASWHAEELLLLPSDNELICVQYFSLSQQCWWKKSCLLEYDTV